MLDGEADEVLDEVDDNNQLTGRTVPRKLAHAQGIPHRTVYVMLYNSAGELLQQQRHANKSICPGLWDLSAAEHLNPGEPYAEAALRGLREELGVPADDALRASLRERLPPSRRSLRVTTASGAYVDDQEFVPVFECTYDGPLAPDGVEVAAVRWQSPAQLRSEANAAPHHFTPWCLETLALLGDGWAGPA